MKILLRLPTHPASAAKEDPAIMAGSTPSAEAASSTKSAHRLTGSTSTGISSGCDSDSCDTSQPLPPLSQVCDGLRRSRGEPRRRCLPFNTTMRGRHVEPQQ